MTQSIQDIELLKYKSLVERFIDKQIIRNQINSQFTTDGRIKDICVLFTDVRGFTTFSEKSGLQATNSFLNNYYDIVIEHTQNLGGIMDKFLGDGTMSIFGAFDEEQSYVERCVEASKRILNDFVSMTSQKDEPTLFLGVGINAGKAIIGAFGNGEFVDFTAIGHTVNVAARIQSVACDNQIYVTRDVTEHLEENEYRSKGYFHLKNVLKSIELFEII
jgi:adenylate cyclase